MSRCKGFTLDGVRCMREAGDQPRCASHRRCPRCPHYDHGTSECMDDACECDMAELAEEYAKNEGWA